MDEVTSKIRQLQSISKKYLAKLAVSPDPNFDYKKLIGNNTSVVRNVQAVLARSYAQQLCQTNINNPPGNRIASLVSNKLSVNIDGGEINRISWDSHKQEVEYFIFMRSKSLWEGATEVSLFLPLSLDIGKKLEEFTIYCRKREWDRSHEIYSMHTYTKETEDKITFDYRKFMKIKQGIN